MEVDRLDLIIEAEADKASKSLDKIVSQLNKVSSALPKINTSGINNISSGIKQMAKSMNEMSSVKATDFNKLAKGIEKLGSINNSAIYKAGNSIRNFANSLESIGSVSDDAVKLSEVARNISKLGGASVTKAVTNLPILSAELKNFMTTLSTAPNVSENIIRMTEAMSALASNGAKFGSTINGISRAANTLTRSNNAATVSTNLFSKSQKNAISPITALTSQVNKLVGAYFTLRYVLGGIASSIKKSMDFTETINLFQTSYKKIGEEAAQDLGMTWGSESADAYAKAFIDRAQAFNDKITEALSLDPNVMMNYQAVFAQISNSMGLVSNTAENISESFTLLGNDIASLWNINTSDAMEKLQSGLTGQVRPLRELGIDITQASLQLTAYRYGIKESVKDMSQAEKVQLRYLTIMDQSEVAYGDMAKTLSSPANQLRILKQQWDNLSRSIGNVFLPIVTAVLPYINAVVMALRNMVDAIASAFGYKLPDYTNSNIYTDVTGDIIDNTDATDDATAANEKYKKSLLGIDELNILSNPSSSDSSKSTDTGSGSSILDDAIAKKTAAYMDKFNEQLESMNNKSKELAKNITDFFNKVYEGAAPARAALSKLWDEGLSKLGNFVWTGLSDFYSEFLVPLGKWAFGTEDAGFTRLVNIINDDLSRIDWNTINKNLKEFWKAIEPYAEQFGEGLIDFFEDASDVITDEIEDLFGKDGILSDLTKTLEDGDPDDAKKWGYAFGVLATGLVALKVAAIGFGFLETPIKLIGKLAKHLKTLSGLDLGGLSKFKSGVAGIGAISQVSEYAEKVLTGTDIMTLEEAQKKAKTQNSMNDSILSMFGIDIERNKDGGIKQVDDFFAGIVESAGEAADKVRQTWDEKVAPWFTLEKWMELGQHVKDGIKKKWDETVGQWIIDTQNWWNNHVTPWFTLEKWLNLGNNIKESIKTKWNETVAQWWQDTQDWWNTKVAPWFTTEKWLYLGQQMKNGIKTKWDETVGQWISDTQSWWDNNVTPWFTISKWTELGSNIKDGIISGFKGAANGVIEILNDIIAGVEDMINTSIGGLNSLVSLGNGITKKAGINIPKLGMVTLGRISPFEDGGFPTPGQLFIANEPGNPELIGNIGGQTAVANNSQIIDGIRQASYEGMMQALTQYGSASSGSSGNSHITVESNLYVDSEKLYGISQKGKAKYERRYQSSLNFI